MARQARNRDVDERDLEVHGQKLAADGLSTEAVSMKRSLQQMGPTGPRGRWRS